MTIDSVAHPPQLDTRNPLVSQQHVLCAAAEMPVDPSPAGRDGALFGTALQVCEWRVSLSERIERMKQTLRGALTR